MIFIVDESYNKANMFNGTFPNLEIGYDLLILSKDPLTTVQNPKAVQTEGDYYLAGYKPENAFSNEHRSGDAPGLLPSVISP